MHLFSTLRLKYILPALGLLLLARILFHAIAPVQVEVATPTRGPAVQAVYATGTVEASVMMPIAPRSAARLMELNVDEGAQVKKDQQLARLEDSNLQEAMNQAKAQEAYAKKEYDRGITLVARKAISKSAFDQAKSNWDQARAALARAEAELGFMKLFAPADGTILRRDGEVGQLIPANEAVFWLSCCAPLRISAEVDEEDIALVQPGQNVLIRADAFPGKVFNGTVQSITPKGDPIARSYRVRIGFNEDVPLLVGMTAETNIITRQSKNALLVPTHAIQQEHVWMVKKGKLAKQPLTLGAKGTEQTEVLRGLTEDALVVLHPDATMNEGTSVRTHRVN